MLGKSTKINLMEAVLLVVVFVLGVWGVHYYWTASKNSKLEIANILNLDNVNEATIDENMICYTERNGTTTVTYNGQNVYHAYVVSGEAKVVEGTSVVTDDVPAKGMTVEITRDVTEKDKRIEKLMWRIDDGSRKIIYIPITICSVIVFEISILLIFGEFKGKNKEEKMEE